MTSASVPPVVRFRYIYIYCNYTNIVVFLENCTYHQGAESGCTGANNNLSIRQDLFKSGGSRCYKNMKHIKNCENQQGMCNKINSEASVRTGEQCCITQISMLHRIAIFQELLLCASFMCLFCLRPAVCVYGIPAAYTCVGGRKHKQEVLMKGDGTCRPTGSYDQLETC